MNGYSLMGRKRDGRKSKLGELHLKRACLYCQTGIAHLHRNNDLIMLAQFNARERSAKTFRALFSKADPRFRVTHVGKPSGSAMAIVEAMWNS